MYSLSCNDLQHLVQIERHCYNIGDPVDSGKFMDFPPQLFIGLFIEPSIFDIDCYNARDNLNKTYFILCEVTRFLRLYTNDANETLCTPKEDDRQCHQATEWNMIGTCFRGKICILQCITDNDRSSLVSYPAAISLT